VSGTGDSGQMSWRDPEEDAEMVGKFDKELDNEEVPLFVSLSLFFSLFFLKNTIPVESVCVFRLESQIAPEMQTENLV
jgi:hypothetical protein